MEYDSEKIKDILNYLTKSYLEGKIPLLSFLRAMRALIRDVESIGLLN